MAHPVLGSLAASQFLRKHWQKKPLFIRGAVPDVRDLFSARQLRKLAQRDDVESRLVTCDRGRWRVEHGPFPASKLARPGARPWSLLVQGVDTHCDSARELLDRFSFIPYARLDDVMVSLAPPGGGVGPHFDSYDVFLLQVHGTRRWQIGAQTDLALIDAPLRILERFTPHEEFVVEPGDLLYLPPHYAHDGVALTDCITCSIGFRAPERQELAHAFLQWLPDALRLEGRYADPDLQPTRRPAALSADMISRIEEMLAGIRWQRSTIERFLGEYLTEPKPNVWFSARGSPLDAREFQRRARAEGVRLARKTRMLYRGQRIFLNGQHVAVPATARTEARRLADERKLRPSMRLPSWWRTLYEWYRAGYVDLGT